MLLSQQPQPSAPPLGMFAGMSLRAEKSGPRKNFCKSGIHARNFYPQPFRASRKNAALYDEQASGATVGRYISSDPIGLAGGLNTFGYVGQNPVMWIDPLGLFGDEPGWFGADYQWGDIAIIGGLMTGPWTLGAALEARAAWAARAAAAAEKKICEASTASVRRKLADYLLNPAHKDGKSKAEWFDKALGYTRKNMDDLAEQLKFNESKAIITEETQWGTKFNQTINVTGANGRSIPVTTGWIRGTDGVPRLITAIPKK